MSPELLDVLERVAELATPGPWFMKWGSVWSGHDNPVAVCSPKPEDAALIAAMRNALPDLLADSQALEQAVSVHRDLTRRLGFGDNITEPQADNDTIVAWYEERCREANEWQESQRWRDDCYLAGHPDDEDCYEHDPTRRLERAEAELHRLREGLTTSAHPLLDNESEGS